MKIRAMQLKDMEEVVGMMRVFYDSPAVIHAAPDEILRQDVKDCVGDCRILRDIFLKKNDRILGYSMVAKKLFYGIWWYMCLGGRSLHERRSERSGDRNCIFQFP